MHRYLAILLALAACKPQQPPPPVCPPPDDTMYLGCAITCDPAAPSCEPGYKCVLGINSKHSCLKPCEGPCMSGATPVPCFKPAGEDVDYCPVCPAG